MDGKPLLLLLSIGSLFPTDCLNWHPIHGFRTVFSRNQAERDGLLGGGHFYLLIVQESGEAAWLPVRSVVAREGLFKPLAQVERRYILTVLEAARGNRSQAAKILDVSEKTLYNKLARYKREDLDRDASSAH